MMLNFLAGYLNNEYYVISMAFQLHMSNAKLKRKKAMN